MRARPTLSRLPRHPPSRPRSPPRATSATTGTGASARTARAPADLSISVASATSSTGPRTWRSASPRSTGEAGPRAGARASDYPAVRAPRKSRDRGAHLQQRRVQAVWATLHPPRVGLHRLPLLRPRPRARPVCRRRPLRLRPRLCPPRLALLQLVPPGLRLRPGLGLVRGHTGRLQHLLRSLTPNVLEVAFPLVTLPLARPARRNLRSCPIAPTPTRVVSPNPAPLLILILLSVLVYTMVPGPPAAPPGGR